MYNLAQTTEKRRFLAMLFDLCLGLPDAPVNKIGRARTPTSVRWCGPQGKPDPDLVADRPDDEEAATWRAEGVRGHRCGRVIRVGMGET